MVKKQPCLPGFEKAIQPVRSSQAAAPRADIVLMSAVESFGINRLEVMLSEIDSLPETPALADVRRLIVGLLAYRRNRDMKQERMF